MKIKNIMIITLLIMFTATYITRVFWINKNAIYADTLKYQKGDIVDFENDYVDCIEECKPGYAIQVLGYDIIDTKSFYKKYNLSNDEEINTTYTPYYCLVKVKFYNNDSDLGEMGGISLYELALVGDDFLSQISENIFCTMYPDMPGMNFSLQKGTCMEFELPYPIDVVTGKDKDYLLNNSPYIEISEYPTRKLVGTR